ncbi:manganese transport protein MntH [compost metagenome]
MVLSLQLPFAAIQLVRLTSSRARMGAYANPRSVVILASLTVGIIIAMNAAMLFLTFREWMN